MAILNPSGKLLNAFFLNNISSPSHLHGKYLQNDQHYNRLEFWRVGGNAITASILAIATSPINITNLFLKTSPSYPQMFGFHFLFSLGSLKIDVALSNNLTVECFSGSILPPTMLINSPFVPLIYHENNLILLWCPLVTLNFFSAFFLIAITVNGKNPSPKNYTQPTLTTCQSVNDLHFILKC